jgi:hypothetical protein
MRPLLSIAIAVLFMGCKSAYNSGDRLAIISSSLERRITEQEAHDIALGDLESAMQKLPKSIAGDEDARLEREILKRKHQRTSQTLEAFLSRAHPSDQLWTYCTATRPCRESGLALLRQGRVVDHVPLLTAYVGR